MLKPRIRRVPQSLVRLHQMRRFNPKLPLMPQKARTQLDPLPTPMTKKNLSLTLLRKLASLPSSATVLFLLCLLILPLSLLLPRAHVEMIAKCVTFWAV